MRKLLCFILWHKPEIEFKINRTKKFSSYGYTKQRSIPFQVISANCYCSRCGKFLTSRWWTE